MASMNLTLVLPSGVRIVFRGLSTACAAHESILKPSWLIGLDCEDERLEVRGVRSKLLLLLRMFKGTDGLMTKFTVKRDEGSGLSFVEDALAVAIPMLFGGCR